MADNTLATPGIDTTVPHVSRVLDYLLGGEANFPVDRAVAAQAFATWPGEVGGIDGVRVDIRGARAALVRIVRHLTAEAGIRQFLDLASGLPTENNVHEAAQAIAPGSRVVYVDKDPAVVSYSRHLLGNGADARIAYLDADAHDPRAILEQAAATLDFSRPVAVVMFGLLHFFDDNERPEQIVATLLDAVPSGSYLAISHFAKDEQDEAMNETFEALNKQWGESVIRRTRAEVTRFFDGLELLEPGVVELPDWRPEPGIAGPRPMPMWCGAARKP
jgi:O-methyltransferase involved in polyketide biosynthesis